VGLGGIPTSVVAVAWSWFFLLGGAPGGLATLADRQRQHRQQRQLTAPDVLPSGNAGSHTGFKLFYREDTGLMEPAAVLALRPRPEVVVYE